MKFALFFGNRGFMPAELIAGARQDMIKAVTDAGHEAFFMDEQIPLSIQATCRDTYGSGSPDTGPR